jgi:hypothetical protein
LTEFLGGAETRGVYFFKDIDIYIFVFENKSAKPLHQKSQVL